ncbi:MFS family permease [Chryseomicrobium aureum]|uniref:MDR family MFS transporter n=1 Tax=Chryseomicrobium aureum TaxID=1441723 RepID=UPI001957320F|nr:MFS transporter [Chryseomicrobium aureum]MBM7706913.1 MFS family permease [Chryseomicrobium aureum]
MPKRVWLLVIGMLINVTGNSLLWPLNTIYMNDYLGKSLSIAGLVLMANAGAGIIGNLLGGWMFDRLGGYKSIMFGITITLVALIGLNFWHGWPHYVYFMILIGLGGGIVFPSMYALVGTAWPEGGRRGFNAIYLAANVGVALGPAAAGIIASYSFDYLFTANMWMYVLFFLLALVAYREYDTKAAVNTNVLQERSKIDRKAPFYALLLISGAYLLAWVGYVQWQSTISTYTQQIGITLKQYSLLWTINGALIVLAQPLIAPVVKRLEHRIKLQMVVGLIIMLISFIVVAFAEQFTMFVVSMVILTLGEMFVWPAVPTIANQLAPPGKIGFYQGIVNSTATVGRMIGPVIGGVIADLQGMSVMLLFITVFMAAAIIPAVLYDSPLRKETEQ